MISRHCTSLSVPNSLYGSAPSDAQPFPEVVLFKYLVEIALGLFVLHANRVLHRDIKPANIFVGANDTIKLGDLGVAKLLSGDAQAKTSIGTPNVRLRRSC